MAKTKAEIQKDYNNRTNYAANRRYAKAHTKMYAVKVVIITEQDIYEKLEEQPSKAGYIKSLIRQDIEENGI